MKRRAARIDSNQNAIVGQLRKMGFSVAITSMVGNGFPDLVVAKSNRTVLVELKDPSKPPSQQKLTLKELVFMELWKGEYIKATTVDEITKLFGKLIYG